jgi:two-component system osmolarity sensor histidine kinase EnvZ
MLPRLTHLPRSLLTRTFLLVGVLLTVSLLVWLALFNYFEREPRGQRLADITSSAINLTRAALLAAEPQRRAGLLTALATSEGIRLVPCETDDVTEPLPENDVLDHFQTLVRSRLGPETRFASQIHQEAGLWVSFQLDPSHPSPEGNFWLGLPRRHEANTALRWIGWTAAAAVLALLAAWALVAYINRPLRQMANACTAIAQRHPHPLLDEHGPTELAALAHALNRLANDLRQLENDRAEVLAGISHDLRTPLSRLRLSIEMLDGTADPALSTGMIADIEQIDTLLRQFLAYARGDADETAHPENLAELLRQIAQQQGLPLLLSNDDGSADPAIAAPIAPDLTVPLRREGLRRAVTNLLDNARKYAPAKPPELLAGATANGIWLEVRDRGPGLPPEECERLKRPFTRGDMARGGPPGSGLGLAIVDRIARLHGGQLQLLPRTGGGLRARLTLPHDGI